jgi:hypothetical protein
LGAAIIHPDVRAVMPRMPAPIGQAEGTEQNAWERQAAQRFVATLRQAHPHRKCILTDESLRSNAPHSETLHPYALHSLLGVKEGDHPFLCQQIPAAAQAGRVTYYERHDRAARGLHRLRFLHEVPRKASNVDVRGNFSASWESGATKVQHCSGVTDLRVRQRNVWHRMRGGRARGKSANETCKTLQNQG